MTSSTGTPRAARTRRSGPHLEDAASWRAVIVEPRVLIPGIICGIVLLAAPVFGLIMIKTRTVDQRYVDLPQGTLPNGSDSARIGKHREYLEIPVTFTPPAIPVAEAGRLTDGQVDPRDHGGDPCRSCCSRCDQDQQRRVGQRCNCWTVPRRPPSTNASCCKRCSPSLLIRRGTACRFGRAIGKAQHTTMANAVKQADRIEGLAHSSTALPRHRQLHGGRRLDRRSGVAVHDLRNRRRTTCPRPKLINCGSRRAGTSSRPTCPGRSPSTWPNGGSRCVPT